MEILIGIKIPFVGEIGKWVKVLGFGFAEARLHPLWRIPRVRQKSRESKSESDRDRWMMATEARPQTSALCHCTTHKWQSMVYRSHLGRRSKKRAANSVHVLASSAGMQNMCSCGSLTLLKAVFMMLLNHSNPWMKLRGYNLSCSSFFTVASLKGGPRGIVTEASYGVAVGWDRA